MSAFIQIESIASLVVATPHGHSRHSPWIGGVGALPFGADDVVRLPGRYSRISYVSVVMKQVELSTCEQRGGRQSSPTHLVRPDGHRLHITGTPYCRHQ
jgi:hypothetical protein